MSRLRLPIGEISETQEFHGTVSCIVSPLGIEFALVEAGPQEIPGRYPQPAAIWLTLLLEGAAVLLDGEVVIDGHDLAAMKHHIEVQDTDRRQAGFSEAEIERLHAIDGTSPAATASEGSS